MAESSENLTSDKIQAETQREESAKRTKVAREKAAESQERAAARQEAKMASGAPAKGPSEAEVKKMMMMAEAAEKRKLTIKIRRYLDRFPELQRGMPPLSDKSSLEDFQYVLEWVKNQLASANSLQSLYGYANMGFAGLEWLWGDGSKLRFLPPQLRLNLTGISKMVTAHMDQFPEIVPLLKEIDAEYPTLGRQSLPMRCIQAVTSVMFKVHMLNTNPAARKAMEMDHKPPVDLGAAAKDL
jgi:hypothetical protein